MRGLSCLASGAPDKKIPEELFCDSADQMLNEALRPICSSSLCNPCRNVQVHTRMTKTIGPTRAR